VIARGESALNSGAAQDRQDADSLPLCLDRLMLHPSLASQKKAADCLRVAAEGLWRGRGAQPCVAACRDRQQWRGAEELNFVSQPSACAPETHRSGSEQVCAESCRDSDHHFRSRLLLLHIQASEALAAPSITVIVDENSRAGSHQARRASALSLERLEALTKRRLQRIGLFATQRPLEEVARFLGGVNLRTLP